jgi:hypothetical protein
MILRCTKRLLDVLGQGRLASPAPQPDPEDLYANLVVIERRKCLLLTHAATLFSVFAPDVRAPELRATKHLVTRLITGALVAEDLAVDTFGNLARDELVVAKTADRRVLTCMNDLAFLCEGDRRQVRRPLPPRRGGAQYLDAPPDPQHERLHTAHRRSPSASPRRELSAPRATRWQDRPGDIRALGS